jgi:hypothetical protein
MLQCSMSMPGQLAITQHSAAAHGSQQPQRYWRPNRRPRHAIDNPPFFLTALADDLGHLAHTMYAQATDQRVQRTRPGAGSLDDRGGSWYSTQCLSISTIEETIDTYLQLYGQIASHTPRPPTSLILIMITGHTCCGGDAGSHILAARWGRQLRRCGWAPVSQERHLGSAASGA